MKACPACNSRYDDNTTYCTRDGSVVVNDGFSPTAPMIGQLIADRYKIIRKIGEGGMGEVYAAEHIHIEKRVALKLLRAEVLSNQEAVSRFRIEARSASSIGHENIIQIDDFGTLLDGRVYMAMEYLQGAALNDMLAHQPLPMPQALDILIQTAKGLAAAHAKGITHRDMKPENVYVTQKEGRDIPKILDFGIAKVSGGDTAQNLTVAGTIFGTPFYMAPEQAMGGKMDHRVDIYAMGIILYEVFTGTVPFKAETFMGILTQHITQAPVPPTQMAAQNGRICPPELDAIILKAMQKDPRARYQSMNELVHALIEFYRFAVGTGGMTQVPWAAQYFGSTTGPAWRASQQLGQIHRPGSGATTVQQRGGSRSWALAVAIGSLAVAGAAVAFVLMHKGDGPESPRNPPPEERRVVVPAGLIPDAAPPPALPPPLPGAPDAGTATVKALAPDAAAAAPPERLPIERHDVPVRPPSGAMVDVTLVSQPLNAIVYSMPGHHYVCQSPCSVTVKVGQKQRYVLELEGYNSAAVVVDGLKKTESRRLSLKGRDTPPEGLKGLEE